MAIKFDVLFNHFNSTKGAERYQEVDVKGNVLNRDDLGAVVNALYLRKTQLKGAMPKKLKVTITEIE